MNIKEAKKQILEKYESIPEMQITAGVYIHTIGNKYIHILNTWNGSEILKIKILDFYSDYIKRI